MVCSASIGALRTVPFCEGVECWSEKVEHRLGNEEVGSGNREVGRQKVEVDG